MEIIYELGIRDYYRHRHLRHPFFFSTIMGAKKGVARTVVSFMQWFVCIIAGFILCDTVKGLLIDYTTTDDAINRYVLEKYAKLIEDSSPYQAMPDLFSDWVNDASIPFYTALRQQSRLR